MKAESYPQRQVRNSQLTAPCQPRACLSENSGAWHRMLPCVQQSTHVPHEPDAEDWQGLWALMVQVFETRQIAVGGPKRTQYLLYWTEPWESYKTSDKWKWPMYDGKTWGLDEH
jgi:hypothetical protein